MSEGGASVLMKAVQRIEAKQDALGAAFLRLAEALGVQSAPRRPGETIAAGIERFMADSEESGRAARAKRTPAAIRFAEDEDDD